MKKISVVVPVYNVEAYLKKCVDSILGQTYANLEVILVDDGSLDNCPGICDDYAGRDKRVKVIHKTNGGLSDARNAAIEIATGEYLICIDSDDYIDDDTIEFLYESITTNNCDIATCSYRSFYVSDSPAEKDRSNTAYVLSNEDALIDMLYQKNVTNCAWAKLYKTSLFTDIRYPVGKICEDLGTTYKLFSISDKIVLNTAKKFHYLQRDGSIINSKFSTSRMDAIVFASEQLDYVKSHHPKAISAAINRIFIEAIFIAIEIPFMSVKHKAEYRKCSNIMRLFGKNVLNDKDSTRMFRAYAGIAAVSPIVLISVFKFKKTVRNILSIIKTADRSKI